MKRTRTLLAVVAILLLVGLVLLPGGSLAAAVLAVAFLVLPLTPVLTRRWAVLSATPSDPHAGSLALLRAPPASSFDR